MVNVFGWKIWTSSSSRLDPWALSWVTGSCPNVAMLSRWRRLFSFSIFKTSDADAFQDLHDCQWTFSCLLSSNFLLQPGHAMAIKTWVEMNWKAACIEGMPVENVDKIQRLSPLHESCDQHDLSIKNCCALLYLWPLHHHGPSAAIHPWPSCTRTSQEWPNDKDRVSFSHQSTLLLLAYILSSSNDILTPYWAAACWIAPSMSPWVSMTKVFYDGPKLLDDEQWVY